MKSVVIRSIDKDHIYKATTAYVAQLRSKHPEIQCVIWFGSWVTGLPNPGGNVDLCLVVTSSNVPARDRISDDLPLGFPVGIDLVVDTQDEFEHLSTESPGWFHALNTGVEI